ncbi:MAG TPA: flagellar basal body rod protein FlgB [Conexibacter sp.]|nr:flagellar basal body rod protein FlgB [Conexibacter sp.]
MSLFDTTQLSLEAALRGASLRQTLLTSNLANVNTPGYQRKDVDFHATLRAAQETAAPLEEISFDAVTESDRVVRPDGSGVDADTEAAALAQNALEYQALVQVASARTGILQTAMGVR